jgi:hypothetical protein
MKVVYHLKVARVNHGVMQQMRPKKHQAQPGVSETVEMFGAGYGIRTHGLNLGKVACYHYTKPAGIG